MTRRIAFEGIENFRDFGGYGTACGRGLKRGRLYRSGHPAKASEKDLQALAAMEISVIVDLRRTNEREREPAQRWSGFEGAVIENDIGQETVDEWHVFLEGSDLSPGSFHDYLLSYYVRAPGEPRHIDLYSRYFRALGESEGAVLVHCAAGKDRTGVICALTHHLAGVSDDDIFEDYLLTNDPARIAARTATLQQIIFEQTGRMASEAAVQVAMAVAPEYLAAAFAAMRESHGSIDGYLEEALGVDASLRERIHERVLA